MVSIPNLYQTLKTKTLKERKRKMPMDVIKMTLMERDLMKEHLALV